MADRAVHSPEEAIRLRSYFIWKREGCPAGRALAHWLQAKAELEEMDGEPPLRVPPTFVMPRVPISAPPRRRISSRISVAKHFSAAT